MPFFFDDLDFALPVLGSLVRHDQGGKHGTETRCQSLAGIWLQGKCFELDLGEHEDKRDISGSDFGRLNMPGDAIRSMEVPEGVCVAAFNEGGFYGWRVLYHVGRYPSLKPYGQNAEIRSFRPTRSEFSLRDEVVTLYQHVNYNEGREGWFQTFPYNTNGWDYADIVSNDSASSVKVPAGTTVTLYEDGGFRGRELPLRRDVLNLGVEGFNDKCPPSRS